MSATLRIGMTDQSKRVIERDQGRAARVLLALSQGVDQGLREAAAHVQVAKLSGTYQPGGGASGGPVALRSGALRQSIDTAMTDELSGHVGVTQGPAAKYARMILGPDQTTITPKNANHLWIPVGKNLTASGQTRLTPREAFERKIAGGSGSGGGGKALRIFMSKAGNLVAFMRTGETYQRGERKGQAKGYVAFVLKKSVTIQGTDALAEGVKESVPRIIEILQTKIDEARNR
jgi:hypothetical protein